MAQVNATNAQIDAKKAAPRYGRDGEAGGSSQK